MRLPLLLFFAALLPPASLSQTAGTPPTASSLLSPALDGLKGSLAAVRLEKWKAPGPVREETNSNIGSIRRDLDGTLPGLLATADAAPGSVSKNLPVFRNVDALYDVLLRVVETADLSAPEADTDALHAALSSLENARRSLGDAIEAAAVSQEEQVSSLRARIETQQTAAPKPASATVVDDGDKPAPVHKRRTTKTPTKTTAKPPAPTPQ